MSKRLHWSLIPMVTALAVATGWSEDPADFDSAIRAIQSQIEAGDVDGATVALEILKQRGDSSSARIHSRLLNIEGVLEFVRGNATAAGVFFARSVETAPDHALRATHAFNAALAASRAGDAETYARFSGELARAVEPGSTLPGDLDMERGLAEASGLSADAFDILETFLRVHPDHPRVATAEITLAELYLTQVPPQPVAAREHIDAARERPLSLSHREWLDHVAIWVEVAAADPASTVQRAAQFLNDWPRSPRRPGVLMVLGEAYYRMDDYPKAMVPFEELEKESPGSELAEAALFFAAKSASLARGPENQSKAIALWSRVAALGGPLAAPALHEVGLLELEREAFPAAIAAFEAVEALPSIDPTLRVAARADRGEAYYAQASASGNDPVALEAAVEAFSGIQSDPAAGKSWRLQAAVRQGKCLEALGRPDEALKLYSTVVQDGAPAGPVTAAPVAEFDWFYRAGLAAIRLLQDEEKWREAVAIADRVAQSGGPRATEAARIGERLRLRHFIWQDPSL